MIKNALFSLVALALVGCASSPKVGERNFLNEPVNLKANSSEALRLASNIGITGVRDLSALEYEKVEGDASKLATYQSGRASASSGAALVTAGAGLASGLSLEYISGIGLLGAVGRDNRVDNYSFSNDFDSRLKVFVPSGREGLESLKNTLLEALDVFSAETSWEVSGEPILTKAPSAATLHMTTKYTGVGSDQSASSMFLFVLNCENGEDVCWGKYKLQQDKGAGVFITSFMITLSKKAPEAVFYLPPNREIFQLPAILKNGEMTYLVEK